MRFESEIIVKGTREGGEKTHTPKKTQDFFLKTMWKISLAWFQSQLDFVSSHLEQACQAGNTVEDTPVLITTCGLRI